MYLVAPPAGGYESDHPWYSIERLLVALGPAGAFAAVSFVALLVGSALEAGRDMVGRAVHGEAHGQWHSSAWIYLAADRRMSEDQLDAETASGSSDLNRRRELVDRIEAEVRSRFDWACQFALVGLSAAVVAARDRSWTWATHLAGPLLAVAAVVLLDAFAKRRSAALDLGWNPHADGDYEVKSFTAEQLAELFGEDD